MEIWQPNLVAAVWDSIDHGEKYGWPKKPFSVAALQSVLPSIPADIGSASDKAAANRLLRRELSLRALSVKHKNEAARWIVGTWGGIGRKTDEITIPEWLAELNEFTPTDVAAFVNKMKIKRISSWSKLLAFANRDAYAIYDSWTTTALNYGLYKHGVPERFRMPTGRPNKVRDLARKHLRPRSRKHYVGYTSYLSLLRQAVDVGRAADLLDAEMFLFANG